MHPGPTTEAPVGPSRADRRGIRLWPVLTAAAVVVGAIVVVLVVLADTPGARLARAVDATIAEGSAGVTVTATLQDLPLLGDLDLSVAEGELDFTSEAARLERELPFVESLPLLGRSALEPVELLFVGDTAWVRAPVAAERSWIRLGEEPEPAGDAASTAPGLANPLAVLVLLQAIEASPQEEGDDVVDGVSTTHFRVLVDLDRLAEQLGDEQSRLLEGLTRLHPEGRMPLDVWIDSEDRIRRVAYAGRLDVAGVTDLDVRVRVALSEFGRPVDVSVPSEEETLDPSLDALRDLDPLQWLRELLERVPGLP